MSGSHLAWFKTAGTLGGAVATVIYTVILQNRVTKHGSRMIATALTVHFMPVDDIPTVVGAILDGDTTSLVLLAAETS